VSDAIQIAHTAFDRANLEDGGHGVDEPVFANVYDMLLAGMATATVDGVGYLIFRGQLDSRWELVPSSRRTQPPRSELLRYSAVNGQIAYLQQKYPLIDLSTLTPEQREAVAQHYFSETELLDFTDSMLIAAFFASDPSAIAMAELPPTGAVYRISRSDLESLGVATVEAPELPPEFTRIHRQQGLFIHVKHHTVINQRALFERWVFRHQPLALPFEWPALGIAAAQLLDDRIGAAGV
jgi:hypothetical protein